MRFHLRSLTLISAAAIAFSSCTKVPDHSQYIPKDAVVVVSIDAKTLGKKIAWNVITGSKLFKKLKQGATDTAAMSNLELSGIDVSNTFYLYVKGDKRYSNGNRVTALVPLTSAANWEAYIKKIFPSATIKQQGNRKEATLTDGMYAGWNDKLLIVMNVLPNPKDYYPGNMDVDTTAPVPAQQPMDAATLSAEMENAFTVSKENQLVENKHFQKLQAAGHDVGFWINYDLLMSQYFNNNVSGMMGGFTPPNTLWKDAAFAGGFDFNKGSIKGDLLYYTSDDLKSIGKDFGSTNTDKEMIDRLPLNNLDMMIAWHLSPKGIKAILEKMNVLGFANIALAKTGMSTDYVLDAFTGDMAICLNDFAMKKTMKAANPMLGIMDTGTSYKPAMNALYVLKINNKANFNRMLKMAADNSGLTPTATGAYIIPISATDSIIIMTNDKYALVANKSANANAYMQGSNKGQALPADAATALNGHPFSMYFDVQQMVKSIDPGSIGNTPHDSTNISEAKKLLSNIMLYGGEYKNDAFEYHMSINFMDKEENSLLQLMDFGMKMNNAGSIAYNAHTGNNMVAAK